MKKRSLCAPLGFGVYTQYPPAARASPANVGIQVMKAVMVALRKAGSKGSLAARARHRGYCVFGVDNRTKERNRPQRRRGVAAP